VADQRADHLAGSPRSRASQDGTVRLVLDTDIGTDVDDVLALAAILGSPELALDGVTTVYGDVLLRARMVARVTRTAGRSVGPIVPGRSTTRSGRPVWWPGHEGRLLPGLDQEQVAVGEDPIALLESAPVVAAIGPLTNIAEASVQDLYMMCGHFTHQTGGSVGRIEHNVRCDVTAADAVFRSGCRATVIGLEQTERVRLGGSVVEQIEATGELGRLLAAEMRQFWQFIDGDSNVPHDPLAVLMITSPELFSFATGRITVDPEDGETTFSPEPDGPHRIVTDLDPERAAREIVSRIVAACSASAGMSGGDSRRTTLTSVQGDLP
jgi:purine nucleosidase